MSRNFESFYTKINFFSFFVQSPMRGRQPKVKPQQITVYFTTSDFAYILIAALLRFSNRRLELNVYLRKGLSTKDIRSQEKRGFV